MIVLKDISFKYTESDCGVKNINLSVANGECIVLTGESGCGKTTITRLINGLAPNYYTGEKTGRVYIDDKDISELKLYEIGKLVGSIFQDPRRQFFSSDLAGEVAFGCENYGFSREMIVNRTDDAIDKMKLNHLLNTPLDVLSGGEKQRTAIASVYALKPRVFVFDEPTANLDSEGIYQLGKTVSELKASGHTLIISEHRLDWLSEIADRYIMISNGEIKGEYSASEFHKMGEKEKISLGLSRGVKVSAKNSPNPNISIAINADKISFRVNRKQIWDKLDIFINERSITAITGRNGIGKTTLALALSGLSRIVKGSIYVKKKKASLSSLRKTVYYCSNDTGTQFFTNSISEELLLNLNCSPEKLNEAREFLKRMGLYDYKDSHPQAMSGGQKQRLAVACALISDKDIIILDEPTSGLDGKNMRLIAEELKNAVKKGKTLLVITHDEEFISECCDYRLNLH